MHRPENFRPDIEGLRGVAVLLVVAYHVGIPGLSGGFVGVDVFFALSGYLITRLLFQELASTGTVDLRRFYGRRIRRLLPAASLVVLSTLLLGLFLYSPIEQVLLARSAMATSAYVSNLWFIHSVGDYFRAEVGANPLLHTWSLAVEEQFYLFWPALLVVAWKVRPGKRTLLLLMTALSAISLAACIWLTSSRPTWAFYASPPRAWEFGFGGVVALGSGALRSYRKAGWALGAAGIVAIIASGLLYSRATVFPGIAAALPVFGTLAVLAVGEHDVANVFTGFLRRPTFQFLGRLSYSWYLWHWPILIFAAVLVPAAPLWLRVGAGCLSLLIAWAAFHVIENPIRFHPRLLKRAGPSLALGATLTIAGISLAQASYVLGRRMLRAPAQHSILAARLDRTRLERDRCVVMFTDPRPRICEYGQRSSSTTVLLFGDSHAMQWFPALQEVADAHGWRLLSLIKAGCPAAEVVVRRSTHDAFPECAQWRAAAFAEIQKLKPTAVIVGDYQGYVANEGMRDWKDPLGEWQAGSRRMFSDLSNYGAIVVSLRDSPRPQGDVPLCLSRQAYKPFPRKLSCDFPAADTLAFATFRAQRQAAVGLDHVHVLDLSDHFCGPERCSVMHGSTIVYRDANHITTAFAQTLTPAIADFLVPLLQRARSDRSGSVSPALSARLPRQSARPQTAS